MKKIIFTFVPTFAIGLIFLTSMTDKPSIVKNRFDKNKASEAGSTFCPVVGQTSQISSPENEIAPYKHCEECKTGVYLEDKNGVNRCTFCGKKY
jgi:uncharacterized Zn finger protein (UPF0148 family)